MGLNLAAAIIVTLAAEHAPKPAEGDQPHIEPGVYGFKTELAGLVIGVNPDDTFDVVAFHDNGSVVMRGLTAGEGPDTIRAA